uniref:ABC transporter n=1 Tax=Neobacillus citreus TaxID=2833578 RepID=A0A942SXH4_9BACI
MTQHHPHQTRSRLLATLALTAGAAITLTACSSGSPTPASTTEAAKPHGYVAGATEAQEPQLRLLSVSEGGEVGLHDLLSGEDDDLDDVEAPEHHATDGRFLVTTGADHTTILDGGAWTVDHGDHTHYYAAEPRVVGTLDGTGPVDVHSSETVTTVSWPDAGRSVALDRAALGQGDVEVVAEVDAGVLLPVTDGFVAATDDGVGVLDADGEPAAGATTTACAEPAGGIVTRAGATIGCADGAVIVDDSGTATTVALPDGAPRATSFHARAGRPTVAGIAGDVGYWLLDTRQGSWRLVETERPVTAVTAVDDDEEHVVAVQDDGRVVVTDGTGASNSTEPLLEDQATPLLQLDAQRAYLADPTDGVVHEVDFADGARVARTIELGTTPAAFAEVGL